MTELFENKLFRVLFGALLLTVAYWMSEHDRNEFAIYLLTAVGGLLVVSVIFGIVRNLGSGKKGGSRQRKKH